MLSVVLFIIVTTLLFLGSYRKPVATVLPVSHHDCVVRKSQALSAYADFVLDGGYILDV